MATKKEQVLNQALTDTDDYTVSLKATILAYHKILFFIKNGDSANTLQYVIKGVMDVEDQTNSVRTLLSATDLTAGSIGMHSLTDPYDGVWIEVRRKTGGQTISSVKIWINRR